MKRNNVLTMFTRISQHLRATARSIAGQDNTDDILQDAFCKLWTLKNLPPDLTQSEKIATTIVKNVSIDYRRLADRNSQSSTIKSDKDDSKEQDTRELFNAVKRIIDSQLNETQRKILWMRDYEGYSFEEIAKQMCLSEENTRQIISRARKIVRETYKRIK